MAYIVPASELFQMAKEILNDGMDYVEISLNQEDTTLPDDPTPPCVSFIGYRKNDPAGYEYEEIYTVSPSET